MRNFVLLIAACFATGAVSAQPRADHVPMTIAASAAESASGIIVQVTPGRTSMRGLPASLRAARRNMHDGLPVPPEQLRALADRRDGLAARRYVTVLLTDPDSSRSDVAFYSALALQAGRKGVLIHMLNAMEDLDPVTEPADRVNRYIAALYPQAWAGNTVALQAVQRFNGEGRLFGALSDRTRDRLLEEMRAVGDGRGQLAMAIRLLETRPDDDLAEVRGLLDEAVRDGHPGVVATATALRARLDDAARVAVLSEGSPTGG
jgi:hypothetical protein